MSVPAKVYHKRFSRKSGLQLSGLLYFLTVFSIKRNPYRLEWAFASLVIAYTNGVSQQPIPQAPAPMVDHTRPHPRIAQLEVSGQRIELKTLKGARLFI